MALYHSLVGAKTSGNISLLVKQSAEDLNYQISPWLASLKYFYMPYIVQILGRSSTALSIRQNITFCFQMLV